MDEQDGEGQGDGDGRHSARVEVNEGHGSVEVDLAPSAMQSAGSVLHSGQGGTSSNSRGMQLYTTGAAQGG